MLQSEQLLCLQQKACLLLWVACQERSDNRQQLADGGKDRSQTHPKHLLCQQQLVGGFPCLRTLFQRIRQGKSQDHLLLTKQALLVGFVCVTVGGGTCRQLYQHQASKWPATDMTCKVCLYSRRETRHYDSTDNHHHMTWVPIKRNTCHKNECEQRLDAAHTHVNVPHQQTCSNMVHATWEDTHKHSYTVPTTSAHKLKSCRLHGFCLMQA